MTFGPLAPPDKALELASALLLQRREEGWVITVYLNHHDLTTALSSFHLPDDMRFPPDRGGIGYKESHAREEAQV